jgi:NAD-dependent dihydropyrimidine dehydrogenase PreA subunit
MHALAYDVPLQPGKGTDAMKLAYRQIMVDGSPTAIQGLDDLLAEFEAQGRRPDEPGLGMAMVERLKEDTYIPYGAREAFAAAFRREYAAYLNRTGKGTGSAERDYGTWRGYPREQIPWYPTVDDAHCDGCGVCLRLCSAGALQPTEDGKVAVADPYRCIVGCSSCATICKPGAIAFPPRSILDAYPRKG